MNTPEPYQTLSFDGDSSSLDLQVVQTMAISEASRRQVLSTGRDFNAFLERTGKSLEWQSFLDYLICGVGPKGQPLRPSTLNSRKYALKKLLLAQPGFIHSPAAAAALDLHFKTLKVAKVDNRVLDADHLTAEEVERLFQHCMAGRDRLIRVGIIVKALFETGCRVSELLSIRHEDCTVTDHVEIRIVGKRKKERRVYLSIQVHGLARTFFEGETFLFASERGTTIFRNNTFRAIQRESRRCGIEKNVHPHTLRHSCAMYLLNERKLSAKAVSEYLGHGDVTLTFNAYIHDMPSAADVLTELGRSPESPGPMAEGDQKEDPE